HQTSVYPTPSTFIAFEVLDSILPALFLLHLFITGTLSFAHHDLCCRIQEGRSWSVLPSRHPPCPILSPSPSPRMLPLTLFLFLLLFLLFLFPPSPPPPLPCPLSWLTPSPSLCSPLPPPPVSY